MQVLVMFLVNGACWKLSTSCKRLRCSLSMASADVVSALVLGHLTGLVPADAERALLVVFTALALVFAGRKYTQAVKDDIGDKSVFTCAPPAVLLALCPAPAP